MLETGFKILVPSNWTTKQKGDFFENLAAEILTLKGFRVQQRISEIGKEIDILAVNEDTQETAIVECKFYSSGGTIKAEVINTLIGKASSPSLEVSHAFLMSTVDPSTDAKGLVDQYTKNKNKANKVTLAFFWPSRLVSLYTIVHGIPRPEQRFSRDFLSTVSSIDLVITPETSCWVLVTTKAGEPYKAHVVPTHIQSNQIADFESFNVLAEQSMYWKDVVLDNGLPSSEKTIDYHHNGLDLIQILENVDELTPNSIQAYVRWIVRYLSNLGHCKSPREHKEKLDVLSTLPVTTIVKSLDTALFTNWQSKLARDGQIKQLSQARASIVKLAWSVWRLGYITHEQYLLFNSAVIIYNKEPFQRSMLSIQQLKFLLEAVERQTSSPQKQVRDKIIIHLAALMGFRTEQLINLTWGDIHFEETTMYIQRISNNNQPYWTEAPSRLKSVILEWATFITRSDNLPSSDSYIILPIKRSGEIEQRQVTTRAVSKIIKKIAESMQLSFVTPDDIALTSKGLLKAYMEEKYAIILSELIDVH